MKKGKDFMFGLMKLKPFAEELGVPESTIRTWKRRGDIPLSCFQSIGTTVFVKVDEFKKWIDNNS